MTVVVYCIGLVADHVDAIHEEVNVPESLATVLHCAICLLSD